MKDGAQAVVVIAENGDDDQYLSCPRCGHLFSMRVAIKAAFDAWQIATFGSLK